MIGMRIRFTAGAALVALVVTACETGRTPSFLQGDAGNVGVTSAGSGAEGSVGASGGNAVGGQSSATSTSTMGGQAQGGAGNLGGGTSGVAGAAPANTPDGAVPIDPATITFDVPDDAGTSPDCGGGPCECSSYDIFVDTKQSCAIDIVPESADVGALPVDAEGFITIDDTPFRVLAMDRWGKGHVLAWCDGTTFHELASQFPLAEYLGQVPEPRIASVGYSLFCGPSSTPASLGFGLSNVTYLGTSLPTEYLDDPALLASEWDGLIVCVYTDIVAGPEWSDTMVQFVSQYGKGLALVGEYANTPEQQAGLSSWVLGTGIEFVSISLPWAPAATDVALDCVADLPPILR